MSDVYWPSIYVQFGYIGMIVYVILIIQICKDLLNNAMLNNRCKFSILLILFYMVFGCGYINNSCNIKKKCAYKV